MKKKIIWKCPILNEELVLVTNGSSGKKTGYNINNLTKQTGNYHNVEWDNITRESVETRLNNKTG